MRTLSMKSSLFTFWEDVVFLEAALLATDETRELAKPVTALLDDFKETLSVELDSRRQAVQASARASVADAGLDDGVRALWVDLLHLVRHDRASQLYRALFPHRLQKQVRVALARQLEVVEGMVARLDLPIFPEAFRETQRARLEGLVARGREVLAERERAELERIEARIDIDGFKAEANTVRLGVYAKLLELGNEEGRPRRWADAFFRRPRSRRRAGASEVTEATTDTTPEKVGATSEPAPSETTTESPAA